MNCPYYGHSMENTLIPGICVNQNCLYPKHFYPALKHAAVPGAGVWEVRAKVWEDGGGGIQALSHGASWDEG